MEPQLSALTCKKKGQNLLQGKNFYLRPIWALGAETLNMHLQKAKDKIFFKIVLDGFFFYFFKCFFRVSHMCVALFVSFLAHVNRSLGSEKRSRMTPPRFSDPIAPGFHTHVGNKYIKRNGKKPYETLFAEEK